MKIECVSFAQASQKDAAKTQDTIDLEAGQVVTNMENNSALKTGESRLCRHYGLRVSFRDLNLKICKLIVRTTYYILICTGLPRWHCQPIPARTTRNYKSNDHV